MRCTFILYLVYSTVDFGRVISAHISLVVIFCALRMHGTMKLTGKEWVEEV